MAAVLLTALGLDPATPVDERLGGGPAALAAVAQSSPGTLVVAVSPETPAGAAAALVGAAGAPLREGRSAVASLPAEVRRAGSAAVAVYDDPRLVRERATRPATASVLNGAPPAAVTGVVAAERRRLRAPSAPDSVAGAAEPLFALAALLSCGRTGPLVAVEGASAYAVDVDAGSARVVRAERAALASPPVSDPTPGRIPLSLAAYGRAFEAKVGLLARRCACGALSYPPRVRCDACGDRAGRPARLPRTGEVYTTVTIRTPVPGLACPYSLAIVELDGVGVRILVHVTDSAPNSARIGDRGELVLRRVATRDGVPDYGYGFAPS